MTVINEQKSRSMFSRWVAGTSLLLALSVSLQGTNRPGHSAAAQVRQKGSSTFLTTMGSSKLARQEAADTALTMKTALFGAASSKIR